MVEVNELWANDSMEIVKKSQSLKGLKKLFIMWDRAYNT